MVSVQMNPLLRNLLVLQPLLGWRSTNLRKLVWLVSLQTCKLLHYPLLLLGLKNMSPQKRELSYPHLQTRISHSLNPLVQQLLPGSTQTILQMPELWPWRQARV